MINSPGLAASFHNRTTITRH